MKVQLYLPPGGYFAERWSHGNMMPALGLGYMAAVLEREGIDVELVPTHVLGMSWSDVTKKIAADRPDIVGCTATTENRHLSFRLLREAKRARPEALTLIGGPHLNGTARDTLSHIPEIDAAISGEGEMTLVEIVQALRGGSRDDFGKITGLTWRQNGSIIANPPRGLLPDLNDLPMPARHLEPWSKYNFKITVPGKGQFVCGNIMTSRGCPFTCNFCATPGNWGTRVRALTPENVIREMELLRDRYGCTAIWFFDDTFNFNRKRTFEICELMKARRIQMPWYCEIRVDVMTKDLLALMAETGCYYVGFGIESGSERVCKDIISKRATLKQAYDVIGWCHEFGLIPNPFFIFSHPTETWDEAMETAKVLEDLRPTCDTSAAILHIYPGTELEKRAREEGKLPADFSWVPERGDGVILLPAAQGHAPLYLDKLTWRQLCELIVRFAIGHKRVNLTKKVPQVLFSIRSLDDFTRYAVLGLVYLKSLVRRLFTGRPAPPVPHVSRHEGL